MLGGVEDLGAETVSRLEAFVRKAIDKAAEVQAKQQAEQNKEVNDNATTRSPKHPTMQEHRTQLTPRTTQNNLLADHQNMLNSIQMEEFMLDVSSYYSGNASIASPRRAKSSTSGPSLQQLCPLDMVQHDDFYDEQFSRIKILLWFDCITQHWVPS